MKSFKAILSIGICSLLVAIPALAAPSISLVMDSKKVVIEKGKEKLTDSKAVAPGDILQYSIKVLNKGDAAAYEVEPIGDIPPNTVYVPEKVSSSEYKMQFSIDKGATYSDSPKIKVIKQGKLIIKDAPAERYNKIKWIVKSVSPNKSLLLNYKVKVKK